MRSVRGSVLSLIGILVCVRALLAQGCLECRLETVETLRLGDWRSNGAVPAALPSVTEDRHGRYYVFVSGSQTIHIYDAHGRVVTRLAGGGLDALGAVHAVVTSPLDSLYVFDRAYQRMTVLAPDFTLARTSDLAYRPGFEILHRSDSFVMAAPIRTPAYAGLPLHVLDLTGQIESSFGSITRGFGPDPASSDERAIALGPNGSVWAGHRYRYDLELWSSDRKLIRTLFRRPPWFPSPVRGRMRPALDEAQPWPVVTAIRDHADGVLSVAILVADARWRTAVATTPGQVHATVTDQRLYQDTIIELLSSDTGEVLAAVRLDEIVVGLLSGSRIAVLTNDANGVRTIEVRRLAVKEPVY